MSPTSGRVTTLLLASWCVERLVSRRPVGLSGLEWERCENYDECGEGYTTRVGTCSIDVGSRRLQSSSSSEILGSCNFDTCCEGRRRNNLASHPGRIARLVGSLFQPHEKSTLVRPHEY